MLNSLNTQLRLGVFFIALFLSACSHTPQTKALSSSSFADAAKELSDVPFYPQTEYQCGPAALATVLQYRGKNVLPDDLVDKVYIPEKQGSLQIEMVAATREQGLVPYVITPKLTALLAQIEAGNPVLVMQNLSYQWMPFWHYAVVVGFDVANNELILRSGETKRWRTSFATFERTWARSDYWGLVIMPPDNLPADATLTNWMQAAYDLQQTGYAKTAEEAYRTAIKNWPESAQPGVALANLYFEQQQFNKADAIYADLITTRPNTAVFWNNRAYTLQAMGCDIVAQQVAQCAQTLAPDDTNIQSTVEEMQQSSATNAENCPVISCPE
ncbi:PA2778 family cysteine peptidase [Methylophaga sp. OBS3]|uniref:PA2778 family cysteine peptidase n=1 Tax=Methylophaga sp. OBS3 TaxID=2991934 RepID=UPI0022572257|nr:PA2778 family cysteine peptidase [Methylophaga sp. OBS3]MCX4188865.1 PA2778 family cysteine peptidase [Methylophaga sp. OBS3]